MGETRKKKRKWQQYIMLAVFMVIGGVCGYVMAAHMDATAAADETAAEGLFELAMMFVGMYIGMFLQIIIHEAGHLVFGLLSGYGFCSFRVGSFMLVRQNGKLKMRRFSLAGTGGQCLMSPPELKDGACPVVLYNMGGSIMNLLAAAACMGVRQILGRETFAGGLLLICAIIGVGFALANGVPMRMGAVDNDGYNTLSLCRNSNARRAFWIQLKGNELLSKGVRTKDMPAEWFEVPTVDEMKNSMIAAIGALACERLMDELRFDEAEALRTRLLDAGVSVVGAQRSLMVCDSIFCELIRQNRSERIEEMCTKAQMKFMKMMKNYPAVLRTEYALALIHRKDPEGAQAVLEKLRAIEKTYPYPCEVQSVLEQIASGCARVD